MSSTAYDGALRLDRRPSAWLGGYLFSVHFLASVSLIVLPMPLFLRAAGVLGVWLALIPLWRRQVSLTAPAAVRWAAWREDDGWTLGLAGGESREAVLLTPYYVTPWLVLLRFPGATLVLLPDSLPGRSWRRLRVRLLAGRTEQD